MLDTLVLELILERHLHFDFSVFIFVFRLMCYGSLFWFIRFLRAVENVVIFIFAVSIVIDGRQSIFVMFVTVIAFIGPN